MFSSSFLSSVFISLLRLKEKDKEKFEGERRKDNNIMEIQDTKNDNLVTVMKLVLTCINDICLTLRKLLNVSFVNHVLLHPSQFIIHSCVRFHITSAV